MSKKKNVKKQSLFIIKTLKNIIKNDSVVLKSFEQIRGIREGVSEENGCFLDTLEPSGNFSITLNFETVK